MDFRDKLIEVCGNANFIIYLYERLSEDEFDRLVKLQLEYYEQLIKTNF